MVYFYVSHIMEAYVSFGKTSTSTDVVYFDQFSFDFSRELLACRHKHIKLPSDVASLLKLLLSHPGDIVSHGQIEKAVWKDRNVNLSTSVHSAIRTLRKVLGDDAKKPRFIETVPRQGYRFIEQLAPEARYEAPFQKRFQPFSANIVLTILALVALGAASVYFVQSPEQYSPTFKILEPPSSVEKTLNEDLQRAYDGIWSQTTDSSDAVAAQFAAKYPEHIEPIAAVGWAILQNVENGGPLSLAKDHFQTLFAAHPRSSYAHAGLAHLLLMYEHDIAGAFRHLQHAITYDPLNADAHRLYAYYHAFYGDLESAVARMALASRLWPDSAMMRAEYGVFLARARKFDAAKSLCKQAISINSALPTAQVCLFFVNWRLGLYDEVKKWGLVLTAEREGAWADTRQLETLNGPAFYDAFWKNTEDYYEHLSGLKPGPRYAVLTMAFAGSGDYDKALEALGKAIEEDRSKPYFIILSIDPHMDHLRNNPDFLALQAKIRSNMKTH